jgi:glycosyltransferase involved in cell wall biosynthesis
LGTPEVVTSPTTGILAKNRSPDALVSALKELLSHYPDSKMVRAYAEQFSWDATTQGQLQIFKKILSNKTL